MAGWFDRPMRWVQLTLVENDPGRFDPQFWLDYFKRLHADAATLSAGGIVAYYPTEVPLHHRSAWLGSSDPFGTLVKGCRDLGMHVVARTDPHAVRDEVRQAHPDWIAVNRDGAAGAALGQPGAVGHLRARARTTSSSWTRCTARSSRRYKIDGIFANRWAPQGGDCFCVHCQQNFKAATGLALPRTNDPRDPARRQYLEWRTARLIELWKRWDATVRRANAAARFIPNGPPSIEVGRRARGDSVHRQPGAPRADAAVEQRPARQGVPLGHGPASDRRHLQRRRRRALPLEGLRPERAGNPAVGGRGHRQRPCGPG